VTNFRAAGAHRCVGTAKRFEDLEIWREAWRLANRVFDAIGAGTYGRHARLAEDLASNAIRAMNNIAEGFELGTDRDFARLLRICRSTLGEVRSQLHFAEGRGFLRPAVAASLREGYELLARRVTTLCAYLERHELTQRRRGTPAD
jgi:four helix bundle protein